MKYLIPILLFSFNSFASYPEFFGASYSTQAISNQANLDINDPSNNYYIPALLGFTSKVNFLTQATSTSTHFEPINNVVVTNSTNSSSTTYGNVSTDYTAYEGALLHLSLPLGGEKQIGTLGFSLFMPISSLMETNSGDPFLPEYVLYRSRYRRTSMYLNFAKSLNNEFAFSIGSLVGFQASAEVKTNLSLNGASYGSWGRARSKIVPSLGAIVSIIKKDDQQKYYFTYQQEMKSNFHATFSGEINNPSLALFDSSFDSMINYDPHTFRIGYGKSYNTLDFLSALEYQLWSSYVPPKIYIKKNGGVIVPSSNFESIQLQNTINPKIGFIFHHSNDVNTYLGLGYRMSPFSGDYSGSGNSIDSDAYIGSFGFDVKFSLFNYNTTFGSSLEYQKLKSKRVTKSTGQENQSAGSKIGSGGYNIGGYVTSLNFGVKLNF